MQHSSKEPISSKKQNGFTLIEILFVVIMLSVIIGLAIPSLSKSSVDFKLSDESQNIVSLSIYARQRAISESRIYRINIDEEQNSYNLLYRDEATTNFTSPLDKFGQTYYLGGDLKIKSDKSAINFYPDSRVDQATISITSSKGKTINLISQPFLGDIRIEDKIAKND